MIRLGLITGDLKWNKTGIGTYTFQLIENIKNNADITLIKHPDGDTIPGCSSLVSSLPPGNFSHILWSRALSLKKQSLKKFDIIHNPAQYPVSPGINQNYIITIHDLIPILYPEYVGTIYALQAKYFYPRAMNHASKIITDSYHTKKDIIRLYKVPETKIEVVYPGVSEYFTPASGEEKLRIKLKYNLHTPFILFVGAIEPKKNIEQLIKAFYICQKENPDLNLVIAGKRAWKSEPVFNLIETLNLKKKIRVLDFVPYEDLPALYSSAELFVFPSNYEGFGLPPLEAMRCGTPVIVSNRSSLPEIAGRGGIMIDPDDVQQMSHAILKVINDPGIRTTLSEYYLKQADKFTWERCAQKTMDIYESVLTGSISTRVNR